MTDNPAISIASAAQGRAADPASSAWVSASAGSGKTKVLTDRVLNLLLAGVPPGRILCVTFTKAAAAEMANRIQERLARWTAMNTVNLEADLRELTGPRFEADLVPMARRLFADVLDAPQSLRIETLHAFCQSVLRRFPLEAGISPSFELLDDEGTQSLLWEQEEAVLTRTDTSDLTRALSFITARQHELRFSELLSQIVAHRGAFQSMLTRHGGLTGLRNALATELQIDPESTAEGIIWQACQDEALDRLGLGEAVTALNASSKSSDQDRAKSIADWLAQATERENLFHSYCGIFLTQKGEPRKTLATKEVSVAGPGVPEILETEQRRLLAVLDQIRAATVLEASWALACVAQSIDTGYGEAKARLGRLDYNDLIRGTGHLLNHAQMAAWVLFKLDGGIDHVLVDETQDTNQSQWDILNALTAEFYAGMGRERPDDAIDRTLFAVGDAKQSIYRFQGADPRAFHKMQDYHSEKVTAANAAWRHERLAVSFRSAPAVLQAVDAVFAEEQSARAGVAAQGEEIIHMAARKDAPGRVEVWPLVPAPDTPAPEPWKPPVDQQTTTSARDKLAALVAKQISTMIEGGEARAGDVMVLVRRRSGFVDELLRQLKLQHVPVAGADRLRLVDHIAVMDMLALGDILLLPDDDLSLACVLKSPLIGLTEEQLFELAHGREGRLWAALAEHTGSSNVFGRAHGYLVDLAARVDFDSPYALFAHVLATGGLSKFQARLGADVQDPLDALLSEALRFEQDHPASLQGFLQWLRTANVEIKRELDQTGANAVRIMTVHGAKGLQAPIVILPDTTSVPPAPSGLYQDAEKDLLFWAPKVEDLDPVTRKLREDLKRAEAEEQHRLLYVAMTRAEDRLIICGWSPSRRLPDDCWYTLMSEGVQNVATQSGDLPSEVADVTQSDQMLLLSDQTTAPMPHSEHLHLALPDLPEHLTGPPLPEPDPPRPLSPSETVDDSPGLPPFSETVSDPFARGRFIHKLLEHLPDVALDQRDALAQHIQRRDDSSLTDAEKQGATAEAFGLLAHPDWQVLFGPESQAEVPVTGLINGQVISGRLDRIAITNDVVWIADYKTNRPPPQEVSSIPTAYLMQMRGYRGLIQKIYPNHRVRCLLLWTHTGVAMEVPESMLSEGISG